MQLLDEYLLSHNRGIIIQQLNDLQCNCKDAWYSQLMATLELTLQERVRVAYQAIGEHILGRQWWAGHGESVIHNIPAHEIAKEK